MARDFPATSGNYLGVGDVSAIDITGTALTVHAWGRPDTLPTFQTLVGKYATGLTGLQYLLRFDGSTVGVHIGDGVGIDSAAGGTVSVSNWHSAGLVKNGIGADALKAYLNGAQVASVTSNRSIANLAAGLRIGDSDFGGEPFDGLLAEVAIWDAALTADEMTALGKGFSAALIRPQSLKGYWPIIGRASPEPDLRNSNNGTLNGSVPVAVHPRIIMPTSGIWTP